MVRPHSPATRSTALLVPLFNGSFSGSWIWYLISFVICFDIIFCYFKPENMTIPSFYFSNWNIVIMYIYKPSFYNYKVSLASISPISISSLVWTDSSIRFIQLNSAASSDVEGGGFATLINLCSKWYLVILSVGYDRSHRIVRKQGWWYPVAFFTL